MCALHSCKISIGNITFTFHNIGLSSAANLKRLLGKDLHLGSNAFCETKSGTIVV